MARLTKHGLGGAVAVAASLLLGMGPMASVAAPQQHYEGPHGGQHYGGQHYGGQHYGGPHYGGPHYGGPHYGGPRYAVPSHWVGMHPHWGGPHPGYWVRPWGPRWVPHYWAGGYWGGRFWPHVYLGWDFPWFLAALPVGYATYYWGGVPYYYYQGVYYAYNPDYGQYVVTDPPPISGGAVEGATAPPAEGAPGEIAGGDSRGAMSLFVYPKQGQSKEQTDGDRYQCHQWAVGQTGFDPTNTTANNGAATATPANYKRAVTACLEARGYSVK